MIKKSLKKKLVFLLIFGMILGLTKGQDVMGVNKGVEENQMEISEDSEQNSTEMPTETTTGSALTTTGSALTTTGSAVKPLLKLGKTKLTLQAYTKVKTKKGIYVPKIKMTEKLDAQYDKDKYVIKYTSSNNKIASVSKKGKVMGIKMGTVKIKVSIYSIENKKELIACDFVCVTVKPTIYIKYLTKGKYVINGGKKYSKKRGIQIKIVGCNKPFWIFYKADRKKYAVYMKKKWKKKIKSVPNERKTWIPLSGKKYKFYTSIKKKGKSKLNSNVISWKI